MRKTEEVETLVFRRGYAHTLEETGRMLGITRERVRQIERRALEKIRRRLLEAYGARCVADMI